MFSNAHNVVFTGNPTFTNIVHNSPVPLAGDPTNEGIKLLLQHVAKGAMHNSGERFDAPTCHPMTRTAIQNDILSWADELNSSQLVTWLSGPAGAGKSAIAQTICEILHKKGRLTASFFFSRSSGGYGRSDETRLMATLAYQLSRSVSATRRYIAAGILNNQLVFDLSLDSQVQELIIDPLTAIHEDDTSPQIPMFIVVDGLDECRMDDNAQGRIVAALLRAVGSIPHLKLFITSRREHHILAIFKEHKRRLAISEVELNSHWKPDDDIRAFLTAGFADIRRSHPHFDDLPEDHKWPHPSLIDELVRRSSGQFIYASVILKYIQSDDYYDPPGRLKAVIHLSYKMSKEDNALAFADLDGLYTHLFSQIPGVERVLTVLSLERLYRQVHRSMYLAPLAQVLSDVIEAPFDEIRFWLRPLVSLLVWENNRIQYVHASLQDFLDNPSRSGPFCLDSVSIATRLVRRAIDLLEVRDTLTNCYLLPVLLNVPRLYCRKLPADDRAQIILMLSDFNIVEKVICRMSSQLLSYAAIHGIASYLTWILKEWRNHDNTFECRQSLVEHVSQIQTWLMQHLAYESFHGQDNVDNIDLWPFFAFGGMSSVKCCAGDVKRYISRRIHMALEICGPTTFTYHLLRDREVELSQPILLLCFMMPYIRDWLSSVDLLGRYAITRERYAIAVLRVSRYLLRLPKTKLMDGLVLVAFDKTASPSMRFARWALAELILGVPVTIEMYFFVLSMQSSIVAHAKWRRSVMRTMLLKVPPTVNLPGMASHTKDYLRMAHYSPVFNQALRDPTSQEYKDARAHAEATWKNIKRDYFDPILGVILEPGSELEPDLSHTHIESCPQMKTPST